MGHFFSEANVTIWSEISAGVFLLLFGAIVWWTYSPAQKLRFARDEQLPLEDSVNDRGTHG